MIGPEYKAHRKTLLSSLTGLHLEMSYQPIRRSNNHERNTEILERLKEFPSGTRVALVKMDDLLYIKSW